MDSDYNSSLQDNNAEGLVVLHDADGLSFNWDYDAVDLPDGLPLIELRNNVSFPYTLLPITIGRKRSRQIIEEFGSSNGLIAIVTQRNALEENPKPSGMYRVGTMARIQRVLEGQNGQMAIMALGIQRIKIVKFLQEKPYFVVQAKAYPEHEADFKSQPMEMQLDVLRHLDADLSELTGDRMRNVLAFPFFKNKPESYVNVLSHRLPIPLEEKQKLLEVSDYAERITLLQELISREIQTLNLQKEIQERTQHKLDKQQRDFILQQQLGVIQEELGTTPGTGDADKLEKKAKRLKLSKDAREVFNRELDRLRQMNSMSPDYSIQLSYLQFFTDLPWAKFSKDNYDLNYAQQCLDADHYGLEKVKERILEFLAVLKLKNDLKSPIICLYGPPGVGKTSLGKSIAKALGRQYTRVSLGGLHDEAEIRGHRRTYVGAMPGRILQSLRKVKTANPVFVLDEIDKVTSNMMGDPASALLEVLDPDQRNSFYDNYLETEFDLSNVLFITTANDISTIAPPLRDRMEMVEVTGYIVEEKIAIAQRHLIPKQLAAHGVQREQFAMSDALVSRVISDYTRESGVRRLDQVIAKLVRQQAKRIAMGEAYNVDLTADDVRERLGGPTFLPDTYEGHADVGVAIGMAWTSVGGDILYIESSMAPGKGTLSLTGNLGNVMKESATIAFEYIKAHGEQFGINVQDLAEKNVHVHVPEGAIPKDGPSAGVTMITSILSCLTHLPPTPGIAMTGETTLRGKVLPVGGIKEKILAAKRANLLHIVLPRDNQKDIEEIKPIYIEGLRFDYIDTVDDLVTIMFPDIKLGTPAEA